jgi:hypothetical protein
MTLSTALRKFVPVLDGSCHPEPKATLAPPQGSRNVIILIRTLATTDRPAG